MSHLLAVLFFVFTVRGEVRDAVTGEPVAGVAVAPVDARGGTITDDSGRFVLELATSGRLRFARLGYQTAELEVSRDTSLVVMLYFVTAPRAVFVTATLGL